MPSTAATNNDNASEQPRQEQISSADADDAAKADDETTSPPPKKKQRRTTTAKKSPSASSSSPSSKTNKAATTKAKSSSPTSKKAPTKKKNTLQQPQQPPPLHILVIDNGGDTVKFGWATTTTTTAPDNKDDATTTTPHCIPNVTARLQQQWTVLVADLIGTQIQNPNQLVGVTRSTERGVVTNMGNQVQVWKRVLDIMNISLPLGSSTKDLCAAFGWKVPKATTNQSSIAPHTCAVLLTVPPHCPRAVLDQMYMVWMSDFGFGHVGLCTGPLVSAQSHCLQNKYETSCTVDLGWSATHVVPTHRGRPPIRSDNDNNDPKCLGVRRLPLGARHLIRTWQYHCSYRQWNLLDQEWILRACLEQAGFVSLNFGQDMALAQTWPSGLRPYDLDAVLPDYQTTTHVRIQTPPALERRLQHEREQQQQQAQQEDNDDDDDSSDESVREEDMNEEDIEEGADDDDDDQEDGVAESEKATKKSAAKKNPKKKLSSKEERKDEEEDADDDEEDDEEDEEALRQRIFKERAEEEKRKKQLELEQQLLRISLERFAIPEALFRPSDVGLPVHWAGLAWSIHQSIQACPKHLRAALYRSISLVGGLSQLKNLKERLQVELRAIVPCEYEICVSTTDQSKNRNPAHHCWASLRDLAQATAFREWSVSRDEWEEASHRGAWRRLAIDHGGKYII